MVFDGNSQLIIRDLNSMVLTMYGNLISEIKEVAYQLSSLTWYCFKHVKHEGNGLAHVLTKRAICIADIDVWLKCLPHDLVTKF